MANKKIKKNVVFYDLYPSPFGNKTKQDAFSTIVERIRNDVRVKNTSAFIKHGENDYLIDLCMIDEKKEVIKGVIRSFTSQVPELFHKTNYTTRDIEKFEEEDVVFSTHFVIRVKGDHVDLALETNREGPGITNLIFYLEGYGKRVGVFEQIPFVPHVKDSLEQIQKQLGRCSEFTVRVHRSKIQEVKQVDEKLFNAIENIKNSYDTDHTTLILKFDYRDRKETTKVWQTILNITRYFQRNKENKATFEKVEVAGEERSKNLKLDVFNLITDKLTSRVDAEMRENSKSIVSLDFLNNIAVELNAVIEV